MPCRSCGWKNLTYVTACAFCGRPLQDEAEAARRREEFDRLPEALRKDLLEEDARNRAVYEDWLARLRRNRRFHAVTCALLAPLATSIGFFPFIGGFVAFLLPALLDAAMGTSAGLLLNRWRGGEYRGLGLFAGLYVVSFVVRLATGAIAHPLQWGFLALFPFFSALIAIILGYVFGLNLTLRRSIEY